MVFAKSIAGKDGKVTIPAIGALIGYFNHWQLVSPDMKTYNLSANFGWHQPKLWSLTEQGDYTRQIVLQVGKETFYRLEQADGAKVSLKDTTLEMEEITLWPLEDH